MKAPERKKLSREIREQYRNNPEGEVKQIINALPKKYQDAINGRVLQNLPWGEWSKAYFYSVRAGRYILGQALEEYKRLEADRGKQGG